MLTPIIPPDPIEANVDYRYDGCYQSMALVLLQRIVDASGGGGANPQLQEIIDELITLNAEVSTETTLEASRVLLASLDGKDFATQATLALVEAITSQMTFTGGDLNVNASVSLPAGLATEAKQDAQIVLETAANALLTSLDGKDYATQATLEAVRLLVASLDSKDYATEATLATRATEATLELVRLLLVSLEGKDFATEATLAGIKAQTDLLTFTATDLNVTHAAAVAPVSPVWGARTQITVDDTGTIEIPVNLARKALRISNEDGEECYFTFGDFLPVWKEDINLKKKISIIFPLKEVGTGKVRFITNNNKQTVVTYQEGN